MGKESEKEYIYVCKYNWITLLYAWNKHNFENQLYFNKNKSKPKSSGMYLAYKIITIFITLKKNILIHREGRWACNKCLLKEPMKEGAVPHSAHQEPLFPNQGPLNPTSEWFFVKSGQVLGTDRGCAACLRLFPTSRSPSRPCSLFSRLPGLCVGVFLQAALPTSLLLPGPPECINADPYRWAFALLFPLPGMPSIPVYRCPLKKPVL